MSVSSLFTPVRVGNVQLKHRVVMPPLTRFRADINHVPRAMAAEYYAQRASEPGTLIVSEGTFISPEAAGYNHVPGIWTEDQVKGWKQVTDAVHQKGSFIFCQLWALGRAASPQVLQDQGLPYVSASDISLPGRPKTRPLTKAEIKTYVDQYAVAAKNAIRAGFDGVELHGANGYLPDQFLQTKSNNRTDEYGGSPENRIRFVQEIIQSITNAIGEERTAIRVSPWSRFQDMRMEDPIPTFSALAQQLAAAHPKLAYLHVVEPRTIADNDLQDSLVVESDSNDFIQKIWSPRPLIRAGGFTAETAEEAAKQENVLIAFGRGFVANPDLVLRIRNRIKLNVANRADFYRHGSTDPAGYLDYPFFKKSEL